MNRFLALALLLLSCSAHGEEYEAQYGVGGRFGFKMFNADGTLDVDEVDGGTEVSLVCDEAAAVTANQDFVDEGNDYSILLTVAEMRCARISVYVAPTGPVKTFNITTFGDLRAQDKTRGIASGVAQSATSTTIVLDSTTNIADDRLIGSVGTITAGTGSGQRCLVIDWVQSTDTATCHASWLTNPDNTSEYVFSPDLMAVIQVDSLGRVAADVQEISGDAAAADNAESDYDGTGYAKLNSTTGLIDNGVTAAKVATGAIDADAVAADVATELATGAGMLLAFGTCDGDSTTTTCEDAALTQADGFWSNWAAIVVSGHPARCVRGFVSASDRLTWTPALTSSAASVSYRLLAAPECRSFP